MSKQYRYSEIFRSIQGEGAYTGRPTVWYRAWGCNFECAGFGAKDPQNVRVEDLPYNTIDLSNIKKMEDLPVFTQGCDSSYSWSKRYGHLAHRETASEIADKLEALLPDGKFGDNWHIAFTGGEPMMSQSAVVDIMEQFRERSNVPKWITFETNGTQKPRQSFIELFGYNNRLGNWWESKIPGTEIFWSCSPKLSASGESWQEAIRPDILRQYADIYNKGQLKFVVDGTDRVWQEVEEATAEYRKAGIDWPVYIMPVGATREEQEDIQKEICLQTLDRGYNFSGRIHCWIFGNQLGT